MKNKQSARSQITLFDSYNSLFVNTFFENLDAFALASNTVEVVLTASNIC